MPHHWSDTPEGPVVLTLTAYRSLPPKGFAAVILITVAFLTLPLLSVLGTAILWWMLPFLAAAVWALWAALRRSYKDGEVDAGRGRSDADTSSCPRGRAGLGMQYLLGSC